MNFTVSQLPLADGAIYYAFMHSDWMGQLICAVLLCFSVCIWVVMIEKAYSLSQVVNDISVFSRKFREKHNPLGLKDVVAEDRSPAARLYQAACERIAMFHVDNPGGGRRALRDDEIEVIRSTMEQATEEQILLLEKRMGFLSTAVSASPFLGLFGTVWGITLAFTNLAMLGRADVQTLAPGVSGALLTTVIALLVAIPSLVGYNTLGAKLKLITVKLDSFTEEVTARFKIEQVESRQRQQQSSAQSAMAGQQER